MDEQRLMPKNHPLVQKIARLTERQQYVLGCICMNVDWGHNPRTLALLVRLGLIVEKTQTLPFHAGLRMTVKRYEVSDISTHMAFCYWASQQPEVEEALTS
jgi:hypothetical protein